LQRPGAAIADLGTANQDGAGNDNLPYFVLWRIWRNSN
jgi:hypothetical protein